MSIALAGEHRNGIRGIITRLGGAVVMYHAAEDAHRLIALLLVVLALFYEGFLVLPEGINSLLKDTS